MTQKMQLHYMTYVFVVQYRAYTLDGYCRWAVVIFLFDNLREKRSVSLHVLKILAAYSLKITGLRRTQSGQMPPSSHSRPSFFIPCPTLVALASSHF